jgi:glycosyltransferase involved in cell wall biosynthesis
LCFLDKKFTLKKKNELIKQHKNNKIYLEDIIHTNEKKNIFYIYYLKIKFFTDFYHLSNIFRERIQDIVDKNEIDYILDFYDCHDYLYKINNIKKVAYTAHPTFAPVLVRLKLFNLFFRDNSIFRKIFLFFYIRISIKRAESKFRFLLKHFDKVLTINYKTYLDLKKNGFRGRYVPFFGPELKKNKKIVDKNNNKLNIVSSVGEKLATNTIVNNYYTLKYLVPELDKRFHGKFIINTYGPGNHNSCINELISKNKTVIDHGFVEDFIKEFKNNDIMLLCQNSLATKSAVNFGKYRWNLHSVHGRILQAWSLDVCLVVHSNNLQCHPELVSGYNCLAGKNAYEIVTHIINISKNRNLRKRLILNGRRTLKSRFSSEVNINRLINNIIN